MYRIILIFFITSVFIGKSSAQAYTLQQCIDSAVATYIPLQQSSLLAESAEVSWRQSRANLLPFVSADIFHGIYQGRSIDPASNAYVTQSLNSATYQLNTGITVFNGGSIQNGIKQNAAAYEAASLEWQQAKDNLVLNVILSYLQVLNNEDIVTSVTRQAEVSEKQLDRLNILNSQGAIKPSDVTDLNGQLMNDQLSILSADNALQSAKINLSRYMNRQYEKGLKLERIAISEFLEAYTFTPDEVYQKSLQTFAQIKAVELRKNSNAYAVKVARGGLSPSISLGGALNTNYSSIAQNTNGKIPYNTQLQNNVSSSFGVGISIPIFNRWLVRNRVKLADIALKNSELEEGNTRVQLRQQIDQAYINMTNAYDRYKILLQQVNAYTESFKAAEVRFNAGVGTSVDFLITKDRLDRANINLISAKYDFVLRKKILDYYFDNMHIDLKKM